MGYSIKYRHNDVGSVGDLGVEFGFRVKEGSKTEMVKFSINFPKSNRSTRVSGHSVKCSPMSIKSIFNIDYIVGGLIDDTGYISMVELHKYVNNFIVDVLLPSINLYYNNHSCKIGDVNILINNRYMISNEATIVHYIHSEIVSCVKVMFQSGRYK